MTGASEVKITGLAQELCPPSDAGVKETPPNEPSKSNVDAVCILEVAGGSVSAPPVEIEALKDAVGTKLCCWLGIFSCAALKGGSPKGFPSGWTKRKKRERTNLSQAR